MLRQVVLLAAMLSLLVIIGCGKAPETEMQSADNAIQTAKSSGAEEYAADLYQQAMDTLNAAMAAKQEQDSKFALFRSYGKSKNLFASAQALADRAATDAVAEKERVKSEVMQLLESTKSALATASAAVDKAPRGKGTKADIALLKSDLAAANTAFEQATAELDAENYLSAKAKFETILAKAQSITSDIEKARARKTGS